MLKSFHQLTMNLKRGMLIVLEGNDRAGKTTQAKKLAEAFKKEQLPARFISFPDRLTETGLVINKYLQGDIKLHNNAIHLLFTANRWEKFDEMLADINAGVTLIVDRYSYSGIAYSSSKEGADFSWCCAPENGLLKPDIVLFLSCNIENLESREGFGQEAYETNRFQDSVRKSYLRMKENNWITIDASKTIDEVHENIKIEAFKKLPNISGEVGRISFH